MLSILKFSRRARGRLLLLFALLALVGANFAPAAALADDEATQAGALPTINVPGFVGDLNPAHGALFWFGKVTPSINSTDVRMAYNGDKLSVILHTFDRLIWYDPGANANSDLTQYDGATLYLQVADGQGLGSASYRFDAQVSNWEGRNNYQRAYRYANGAWTPTTLTYTTQSGFRGSFNDGLESRGITLRFDLPFASLGLSGAPAKDTVWRLALVQHDRDSQSGPVNPDQVWPAGVDVGQPGTWGRIVFGLPEYKAPNIAQRKTLVLVDGVNGVSAPDGEVGGHSVCGDSSSSNYFALWGEATYPHYYQINIQNQWDVADFPCFSKYYATYPLTGLPQGAKVVSATLEMQMFGNAGYNAGDAQPMLVQVARVSGDWDEQTLNWNNAPPVLENYGGTVVNPMPANNPSGVAFYNWDVSRAVADALANGEPLRLSLHTPAGEYHSGKYFWSADAGADKRPKLTIVYGQQAYAMNVQAPPLPIEPGASIDVPVTISANSEGNPVTVEAGPSNPAGLEISVTPAQVPASGGTVIVKLTDPHGAGFAESAVYRVPIKATAGSTTLTGEIMVIVNGSTLFLPNVARP